MLEYRELMTPYKYYDGSSVIISIERTNDKYRLSDNSHMLCSMMKSHRVDHESIIRVVDICHKHRARIKSNEILMNAYDYDLYIQLDDYCQMLLEIEKAFMDQINETDPKESPSRDG